MLNLDGLQVLPSALSHKGEESRRYYTGDDWALTLFGGYTTPIKIFAGYRQADLVKAYKEEGRAKPLGFAIGYGSKRQASGMQMAVRKSKS